MGAGAEVSADVVDVSDITTSVEDDMTFIVIMKIKYITKLNTSPDTSILDFAPLTRKSRNKN